MLYESVYLVLLILQSKQKLVFCDLQKGVLGDFFFFFVNLIILSVKLRRGFYYVLSFFFKGRMILVVIILIKVLTLV